MGGGDAAPARDNDLFAKVPRFATDAVRAAFKAEVAALTALTVAAGRGLVPHVVGVGQRVHAGETLRVGVWPLLVLRPCGKPLAAWVSARVAAASAIGGAAGAARARRACADAVVVRLLDALDAAHAAGWVHCDVRPPNIVIVGDEAVLVDWGLAVRRGGRACGRSVPAFAASGVFLQHTYAARPSQDVIGALLTWVAIAHGTGCAPPWAAAGSAFADDQRRRARRRAQPRRRCCQRARSREARS